jgi:hypothetical protein
MLSRVSIFRAYLLDRLIVRCGCLCQDLLLRVKDVKNARSSIIDDLHQVAALAESFTEQRPKSNKGWLDMADALDREGQHTCLY